MIGGLDALFIYKTSDEAEDGFNGSFLGNVFSFALGAHFKPHEMLSLSTGSGIDVWYLWGINLDEAKFSLPFWAEGRYWFTPALSTFINTKANMLASDGLNFGKTRQEVKSNQEGGVPLMITIGLGGRTMRRTISLFFLITCLTLTSCVPLTLSREAVIAFGTYQSIRVEINDESFENYAVEELSRVSGFKSVSSSNQDVDAILVITITSDSDDSDFNDEDSGEGVTTSFELRSPEGNVIDSGEEDANSSSYTEAVEDAIDEIANHYLAPIISELSAVPIIWN